MSTGKAAERKKKTELAPGENGHHMESRAEDYACCGYDVKDGKYTLSATRSSLMISTAIERQALNDYVQVMNRFITERFKDIAQREQRWWNDILPALQVPPEQRDSAWRLTFDGDKAVIYRVPAPPAQERTEG